VRFRLQLAAAIAALVAGVALLAWFIPSASAPARPGAAAQGGTPGQASRPAPSSAVTTYPPLLLKPANVAVSTQGFWSWALLDTRTGALTGARMDVRNTTASMIKVWLAADSLRLAANPSQARLALLSTMIRDSDNDAAWTMWRELGEAATIRRLIEVCALTDSRAGSRWSLTELSARDAARMGACIADGRAAGPRWTSWLLTEMRSVRGEGDFGIRKALPATVAKATAIKNGWIAREEDGNWHLNCLAIGDGWVLSVLQRYPRSLGFAHGQAVCRSVAEQLLRA
jgi:hypothetical protein